MKDLETYCALSDLLQGVVVNKLIGDPSVRVEAISFDSRAISKATLFVAIKGTKVNGHNYIQQAIAAGSIVIVCTDIPLSLIHI